MVVAKPVHWGQNCLNCTTILSGTTFSPRLFLKSVLSSFQWCLSFPSFSIFIFLVWLCWFWKSDLESSKMDGICSKLSGTVSHLILNTWCLNTSHYPQDILFEILQYSRLCTIMHIYAHLCSGILASLFPYLCGNICRRPSSKIDVLCKIPVQPEQIVLLPPPKMSTGPKTSQELLWFKDLSYSKLKYSFPKNILGHCSKIIFICYSHRC